MCGSGEGNTAFIYRYDQLLNITKSTISLLPITGVEFSLFCVVSHQLKEVTQELDQEQPKVIRFDHTISTH